MDDNQFKEEDDHALAVRAELAQYKSKYGKIDSQSMMVALMDIKVVMGVVKTDIAWMKKETSEQRASCEKRTVFVNDKISRLEKTNTYFAGAFSVVSVASIAAYKYLLAMLKGA